MSLAATLSASGMRPASFLPAIKCSNCGEEIEISRMGDHVCGSAQAAPHQQRQARPSPPQLSNPYSMPSYQSQNQAPPSPSSYSAPGYRQPATTFAASPLQNAHSPPPDGRVRSPTLQSATSGSLRSARLPMPPRINPDAANKPFLAPSYPRSASPSSPIGSVRSGRSGSSNGSRPPMLRNMTMPSPLVRDRSPSPELASNLDCAFPSFPTSSGTGSRPGTSNGRKTPNSDRAPSRAGTVVDKEYGLEPRSPRTTAGESVMKRANTLKSGPFDAGRRKGSREEKNTGAPVLPASLAITKPATIAEVKPEPQVITRMPPRKSSLPKDSGYASTFEDSPGDSATAFSPASFGNDLPAPLRITDRSQTFPLTHDGHESEKAVLARVPSEPNVRGRDRRPSMASIRSEHSRTRQAEAIARPSSRGGTRTDPRIQDAPPVPRPVQHYRQPSKHAPSESESSASSASQTSNANSSEGPSPVGSAASSIDTFSPLGQASNSSFGDERPKSERMRSAGYSTKSQQQNPGLRAEQPAARSPPPNFARPRLHNGPGSHLQSLASMVESPMYTPSENRRAAEEQHEARWASAAADAAAMRNNTSPTYGERSKTPVSGRPPFTNPFQQQPPALTIPKTDEYDPYRAPSPNPATRSRSKSNASQYSVYPTETPATPAPPPIPTDIGQPRLQRRNTSVRPVCRGCKQVIEGKSVKAADGRLTGRWHKHCFTCKTCSQPFATADFYVINDEPYCNQHYHEKNGSLCSGCHHGIEGQYCETSPNPRTDGQSRKYHPTCFTCADCRTILAQDYFEIAGKVFCERHALAAMRGQARIGAGGYPGRPGPSGLVPPGRRELMAERRTTKLMMMM